MRRHICVQQDIMNKRKNLLHLLQLEGWGMISDSRHRQLCWKPGKPLKMDEQMEDVLTAVSVSALREVHTDPRVLDSLCEKRAVSYLPVTKGGVLTGFGSLQNHCITKNKYCHSSVVKFLSFVSWKAGAVSYCWQRGMPETRGMHLHRKTKCFRRGIVPRAGTGLVLYTPIWLQCAQSQDTCGKWALEHLIPCCTGHILKHAEVAVVLTTVY